MPKKVYSKRLNANLTIPDDWGPEQIAAAEERLLAQEAPSAPTEEKSVPLGGVGAFLQGIGRGVANTVIGIPEGIGGVTGSETIQNIGRGMRESDLGRMLTEPPPESIAQYPKSSQAGELTGNVLTYLTPGAVLKAPRVATTALAMTQGAAEQAREADRMGATPSERQLASILGAATGTLDAVVPNRMTAGLRGLNAANAAANQGIAGVLRRGAGTAVLGGLTEGSQQLAQNKIEQMTYNPNQETMEGVPESVGIGAGVEGLLDIGLQALAGRAGRSVMTKRSRMIASPEVSRTDRNAVGVRSGEGGDPVVEYLAQMNPEFVPMTPEQRSQNFAERMQRMASSAPEAPIDVDVTDAQMRAAYGLPPRAAGQDPFTFAGATRDGVPPPRPTATVAMSSQQPPEDILKQIPIEIPQPDITDLAGVTSRTPIDSGNLTSTTNTPQYSTPGKLKMQASPPMRPDAMSMPAPVSEGGTAAVDASIPFTSPLPQKLSMATPQPTAPQYTIAGMREELNAGKTPELAMDVHRALKGLGVDDLFSTRLVDNMANPVADGQTSGRIIELALLSKDKDAILRTLDHEAVHAMKTMGLFTDMEWSILERAFDPKAILDEQERKFYTDYYKNDMAVKEEAIARGMEKYGRGKIQLAPEIQAVVDRKLTALDRIGNVFRDQQVEAPKQVMDRFASGEIGTRNVDIQNVNQPRTVEEPRPTQDPTANRSTELEDYDTEAKDGGGTEEGKLSYVGRNAAMDERARLIAERMESKGKSPQSIRMATGWFRNPYDKKWRYEVSDDTSSLTDSFAFLPESKLFSEPITARLDEVLDHPELFKAYPELRGVNVVKRPGFLDWGGLQGSFDPKSNTLQITPYAKDPKSTMLHEIQHWIQSKEGFAAGGNENMAVYHIPSERVNKLGAEMLAKAQEDLSATSEKLQKHKRLMELQQQHYEDLIEARALDARAQQAYDKFKQSGDTADRDKWLALYNQNSQYRSELAKRVAGTQDEKRFRTHEEAMNLYEVDKAHEKDAERLEDDLQKYQKKISQIRSGDENTLRMILKQSGAGFDAYKSLSGEIESRDVQARKDYDRSTRKATEPLTSERYDPADAITIYDKDQPRLSVKQLPVPNSPYASHDDRTKLRKAADSVFGGKFGELMDVARQQMIDMRLGIEESGKKAGFTKTEQSAGFITRQMDRAPELAAATAKYGPLQYIGSAGDGYFEVADSPDLAWGKVMKEAHDKGKLDQLRHYLTGERAAALKTQDRENKLTPQQIQQFRDYGKDPEIKAWAERWRKFNDGMIDTLQKSGRIDKDLAAKFKENIYVPFYRVAESDSGDVTFGGSGSSMASAPRIAKLKGGKADLNDFVENIVHNTTMLTQMATKNVAMQRVIRDGLVNGTVVPVRKGEAGKTVKVYINGKEKHFEVKDKLLMRSLTSSLLPFNVAVKFGAIPARVLRSMVTHAPVFAIRNAMRDSATAWAMGYTNTPYTNIASGIRDAVNQAPNFQKLERMGVLGTGIRGEGGDAGTASNIYKDIQSKHNWWDTLQDITSKSEAVSRLTIYDAVKKRGGSDAEAAYQAQEFLNFQRRGGNQIMQIFNALVPFQNARIQGADVFYRGARGQGPMPVKLQRTIAMRAAYLTALGGMYAALMHDNEAYKNAAPDVRDQNFLIPVGNGELFKVPIPFEVGIFKIIGEHTVNMMNGTTDGKDFMKAMKSYLSDTLHLDFIPQAIKPMVETTMNYDNFRQRQVEPEYMKRTEPGLRSDADTSELAKALGKYLDWSPMKIDHWIKGYTGTIGMYTNSLISHLVNENPNEVFDDLFAGKAHDMPLVGAMFQGPNGPRNLIDFYEINSVAEQAANAIKAGAERTDKRVKLAAAERRLQPIETQIRELTTQEKKIRANKSLKRAQKIAALEEVRRRKILLAAPAQQVKRAVQ